MSNGLMNYSIYKSETLNKWVGQIEIGIYSNGKRKYKRFYSEKKTDVSKKVKDYMGKHSATGHLLIPSENISLSDYLEDFLVNIKKRTLQPSSFDREARTIRLHIIPRIGRYSLAELNAEIIQEELLDNLINNGYSFSSSIKAYNSLNAAMKHAVRTKRLSVNPCDLVIPPKNTLFEKEDVRFFNEEEIQLFKDQARQQCKNGTKKYKHGEVILLALYTGIRVGELCALKWNDVDLESRVMKINKISSTSYASGERKTTESKRTKTISGTRYVYLNNSAIEILNNIWKSTYRHDKNNYIVGNSKKIYSIDAISNSFFKIAQAAGINNPKGIHTLRHTFATMLIYKGVDIKVVSEMLGHSSINITYNLYVHVLKEQKAKAMDLIDF